MMTRKHYIQFADMFHTNIKAIDNQNIRSAMAVIARDTADIFRRDNPNFSYQRFFLACGLDDRGYDTIIDWEVK